MIRSAYERVYEGGHMHRRDGMVSLTVLVWIFSGALCASPDDAQEAFDSLYGEDFRRVTATRGTDDDVALAARLLEAARNVGASPALAGLLCERAFVLGAKHPSGHGTALEAIRLVRTKRPELADQHRERVLQIHRERYRAAEGQWRLKAGEELINELLAAGDAREASGDLSGAVGLCQEALKVAQGVRFFGEPHVEVRINRLIARQGADRDIAKLRAWVLAHPEDQVVGGRLVHLLLLEIDRPDEALKYVHPSAPARLVKNLALAGALADRLSEGESLAMAQWYKELADGAQGFAKITALRRARTYYRRHLEFYREEGTAQAKARLAVKDIDAALAEAIAQEYDKATGSPTLLVIKDAEFKSKLESWFPPRGNCAGSGEAAASSTYGARDPNAVFAGKRVGDSWTLAMPSGEFAARWDPPALGRYILLLGRTSGYGNDTWGQATLSVNGGRSIALEGMSGNYVAVLDMGKPTLIRAVHIQIKGRVYPGLAGLEIHRHLSQD